MRFLPFALDTARTALTDAFAAAGRPVPTDVAALRPPDHLAVYSVVDWSGQGWRVEVVLHDLTGAGVADAAVGAIAAGHTDVLTLPLAPLGAPALAFPLGEGRAPRGPEDQGAVLHALGSALAAVHAGPPCAGPPWTATWAHLCQRWVQQARAGRTDLQPVLDDALQDAREVPEPDASARIPGGLDPDAVWLAPDGSATVFGWLPAWVGDPWSAWGPFLHLDASALAALAAASPVQRLADHAPRLRAYAAGQVLRALAEAAGEGSAHGRCRALERALLLADARSSLDERLRAADAREAGPAVVGVRRWPVLAVADRLAREPWPTDGSAWAAVAGAAVLAHHVGAVPGLQGWVDVALESLRRLEPGATPAVRGPHAGPVHAVHAWLLRELREAAGGALPAGLEEGAARLGAPSFGDPLADALLTLAAAERAGDDASVRQALAAFPTVPAPSGDPPSPDAVLRRWSEPSSHASQRLPVALLLLAARRASRLPVPVEHVLAALALTG